MLARRQTHIVIRPRWTFPDFRRPSVKMGVPYFIMQSMTYEYWTPAWGALRVSFSFRTCPLRVPIAIPGQEARFR
ncbi:hypothetical protein Pla52n_60070 [Stieleria varia]|uniref:Uncharacterized protein n=1 Tax=Stieleria varia TaxID=2528005 RepID=A0A5C6A230_9BACT|nr:hypothetical protein Pla52n_60070 [Stieleria varia]